MILQDINAGTVADDGTGDSPRAGALKINANNALIAAALSGSVAGSAFTGAEKLLGLDGGVNKAWLASQLAAYITGLIVDSAPGTLDTLNELAAALGDDPNFATTIATALSGKQPIDSDLTAIAALSTTSWGRALLTMADAAALRSELKVPYILAQSGAASSAWTGSTALHDFATVTIPAGALGANGSIEVEAFWTGTNNANTKTLSIYLGGSALHSTTTTSNSIAGVLARIANRNSQSSQIIPRPTATSPYGNGGTAHGTAAIDTSVDQVLKISGQLAVGTDSLVLESYLIKILPSA